MRRLLWILLVVLLAIPALSLAQYGEDQGSKISVKAGVHMPTGSALTDQSSLWTSFGIDYALRLDDANQPQDVAALTYSGVSKNLITAKLFGLQYVRYWSNSAEGKGFYFGAGGGVFSASLDVDETFGHPAIHESGIKPGLTLIGGYHLGSYWFAEIQYTKMEELGTNADPSGLSFFFGAKGII